MKRIIKPNPNALVLEVDEGLQVLLPERQFILRGNYISLKKLKDIYELIQQEITREEILQKVQDFIADEEVEEILNFLKSNQLLIEVIEESKEALKKEAKMNNTLLNWLQINLKENYISILDVVAQTNLILISLSNHIDFLVSNLNFFGFKKIFVMIVDKEKNQVENLLREYLFECKGMNKIIILIIDGIAPKLIGKVNQICIQEELLKLMLVTITPTWCEVGPTVIPKRTCCLECYVKEKETNLKYYNEYLNVDRNFNTIHKYLLYSIPELFRNLAFTLFTIELYNQLTYATFPLTYNQIIRFNFKQLNTKVNKLYKNPFCSTCSNINFIPPKELYGL